MNERMNERTNEPDRTTTRPPTFNALHPPPNTRSFSIALRTSSSLTFAAAAPRRLMTARMRFSRSISPPFAARVARHASTMETPSYTSECRGGIEWRQLALKSVEDGD
jgi:hypothetical protein